MDFIIYLICKNEHFQMNLFQAIEIILKVNIYRNALLKFKR